MSDRVETRVLNVFLYQDATEGRKYFRMACNFTQRRCHSWRETVNESTSMSDAPLGENLTPEQIADLIKGKLERMHMSGPIEEICLYNEAPWGNGKKQELPYQEYSRIHSTLRDVHIRVYSEPPVIVVTPFP